MPTSPRALTGEEAALYDRQIRLWGLEAQQKLSSSSILLYGRVCSPLAHELAKNIVLAGVARLVLCERGTAARSFLGADAASTAAALQEMNPLVEVSVMEEVDDLKRFGVVCVIGVGRKEQMEIGRACHEKGVCYLAGRCMGSVGWVFLDCGEYKYKMKVKKDVRDGEDSAEWKEKEMNFASFEQAIQANWGGETRRSSFGWHVINSLEEYEIRNGKLPTSEEDMGTLTALYKQLCEEKQPAMGKEEIVQRAAKGCEYELQPIAAVVGGIWGREVVKIVSEKDEPLNNVFFFDAGSNVGSVEKVG